MSVRATSAVSKPVNKIFALALTLKCITGSRNIIDRLGHYVSYNMTEEL